ncbi:MAG: DUF930 domain-containing protein [Parvibaculum sp.]|uniref:DUF930 domain-containing protein n=1 Tax=Parvibaculum sp. TaxID=2024848 RepID=UPI00272F2EC2|nr:DUF930 domain-containing protein [Parvibaculum sp.]MDP2149387.1 DUF930 domain-containing protein [Parvibaculum sp.]
MGSGLALSLLLHALILAGLLVTLPEPEPETASEEQAVEVTMVEESEAPEAPEIPEPPPEPEPPAPPEPEAPEPDEPEAPEPETPDSQAPDPAPEAAGAGEAAPIQVLRPVVQFGDDDSGPRLAPDGDSAEDRGTPETAQAETLDAAAPSEPESAAPPPASETAEPEIAETDIALSEQARSEPPATQVPGIALPEIALPEAPLAGGRLAEPDPAAPAELAETALAAPSETAPEPDPSGDLPASGLTAPEPAGTELAEAGTLLSPVLTEDPVAMAAMGDLPRGVRASQLCTTELREQLRRDPRRYGIELLPSYLLEAGNVLAVNDAAFRADGAWLEVSFRCTVDDEALKVVGFAHRVGAAIPRDEWSARGFPSF